MPSRIPLLTVLLFTLPMAVRAEPTAARIEHFEKKVRPILAENCYACHSTEAKKNKGGLLVDSLASLLEGGDTGPAIIVGQPDKSLLIEAVRQTNSELVMPPKAKLTEAQIAILSDWVKEGAPWPVAEGASNRRRPGKITDEDRQWWSFRPVRKVAAPAAGDGWARNEIDRFIAAKQKDAGLLPTPEANRTVLIRRLSFDLVGLPPTPSEVEAFLKDSEADLDAAYDRLVTRLLDSPRYGERWARHWLDLVRYADSDGYRIDDFRPAAYRYRDYVIRAFNTDKPYDRFVNEQLAGDEMYPDDPDARVATGYLRHWIYEYNSRDVRGQWSVVLNDITDTTSDVFMGLGLQCARCHDHKFDPLLQKDYFRLQAFFANMLPRDDQFAATAKDKADHALRMKEWETKTATLRNELNEIEAPYRKKAADNAIKKFPDDIQAMIRKPASEREPLEHQLAELAYRQVYYEYDRLERTLSPADKERALAIKRELAAFDAIKPPPLPLAFAASDVGKKAPDVTIPKRPNDPIAPGFPTILHEGPAAIPDLPNSSGRRTALANWLTNPANPLTARVMVNRVWQQHFGKGLAINASDFGHLGEPPTHPELLDYLATRFVDEGWSMKKLHRLIVTSATYRQTATPEKTLSAKQQLIDPENRLLWRGNVRRLDAEQIRDAVFSVTGELDLKAGGPAAAATDPRRSVYAKVLRNNRDALLDVFDAPFGFNSTASRDTTTTPVQSLLLINSSMMLRRATSLAQRVEKAEPDEARRITLLYSLAFGREPTSDELSTAREFLKRQANRIDPVKTASAAASFVPGKIPYRDGQAAEMKLDAAAFQIPHGDMLPDKDFTIEAYVYPRSVAETGAVRTIAAKGPGDGKAPGWAFGITGKKSRRKPQTVVMQLFGKKADGTVVEEALFADLHVQMNKPYYLAASVKLAGKTPGEVMFYLKDLSNDDEPLLTAKLEHAIVGGMTNAQPLTLGSRGKAGTFDGMLDDVRLSDQALGVDKLLFTHEGVIKSTIGYWQFEAKPNVFRDASGHGLDISTTEVRVNATPAGVNKSAWIDLCHVLLNASEFLYVE